MVDPLMTILIFMIILIFLLIILFKIRIMLHLKALNKYKHKNKVYLLYYEIHHVNYGFKENGEKTQFFINGKIFKFKDVRWNPISSPFLFIKL